MRKLTDEQLRVAAENAAGLAAPIFRHNDWRFRSPWSGEDHVPSEAELVDTVTGLLESAAPETTMLVRSGRFVVRRVVDECGEEEAIIALELGVVYPGDREAA